MVAFSIAACMWAVLPAQILKKVFSLVTLRSYYARALTFENFGKGAFVAAAALHLEV
jgi:hypothetical protein